MPLADLGQFMILYIISPNNLYTKNVDSENARPQNDFLSGQLIWWATFTEATTTLVQSYPGYPYLGYPKPRLSEHSSERGVC